MGGTAPTAAFRQVETAALRELDRRQTIAEAAREQLAAHDRSEREGFGLER
jgi:hypothetical protein